MPVLFTIGYEGADLPSVVGILSANGVEEVVDVRLTPISRKPGFSKSALAEALAERGIGYRHYAALGCPKDVRVRYSETGDFGSYSREYRARVLGRASGTLGALAESALAHRVCLLCFEQDAARCHRGLVAERARQLSQEAVQVAHLAVPSSGRASR